MSLQGRSVCQYGIVHHEKPFDTTAQHTVIIDCNNTTVHNAQFRRQIGLS